jgi:hypothetical protein
MLGMFGRFSKRWKTEALNSLMVMVADQEYACTDPLEPASQINETNPIFPLS